MRPSFTVTLVRSGMTLNMSENESIVDVLDAHGVFVPTSCRPGICGSRETRVIAGKIDHRDSIVSADEKQRDETMMVCSLEGERWEHYAGYLTFAVRTIPPSVRPNGGSEVSTPRQSIDFSKVQESREATRGR